MSVSEKLDSHTFYPLAQYQKDYRVKFTGEYRAPKRGEWYLSGAIIQAYRALSDLTTTYPIGKLYKVRKIEYWEPIDEGQ